MLFLLIVAHYEHASQVLNTTTLRIGDVLLRFTQVIHRARAPWPAPFLASRSDPESTFGEPVDRP
jgi:hypothetical protein